METVKSYQQQSGPDAMNSKVRNWMGWSVALFLTASLFGLAMRYLFVGELPFLRYKFLLHAHSHVALMGWAYMLVSGSLLYLFVKHVPNRKAYDVLMAVNVVCAAGMALSFPIQGYGAVSLTFSTLHLFVAYTFGFLFLSDIRDDRTGAARLARWSVYWLLISTVGLWAITPVVMVFGKLHPLYFMCIQFFLHFQLNGWLTYGVLGILWKHAEGKQQEMQLQSHGFWVLQVSLVLTYALSVTWSNPLPALFVMNSIGVMLQLVALWFVVRPVLPTISFPLRRGTWKQWMVAAGVASLVLKVLIHVAVAVPVVAEISYTIKNFVIGFIHLVVLGSVTLTVVGILLERNLLPSDGISKRGWQLLLAAFILTELLLMGQGLLLWMQLGFLPHYHLILFLISALFPLALMLVVSGFLKLPPITVTESLKAIPQPVQTLKNQPS